MDFLNKFFENVEKFPDRPAVRTAGKRHLSYLELDEYSAKVYRWLNSHAIGTEDIVLIFLPRGSRLLVSVIGVMKAGAAFVIAETNSPEERIAFIKKDCSCRTVIDEELYSEMMKEESLSGHKKPAEHDACFAVYTSGTTGNPKGVIHEYGKLDDMIPALLAPRKETPGAAGIRVSAADVVRGICLCFPKLSLSGQLFRPRSRGYRKRSGSAL